MQPSPAERPVIVVDDNPDDLFFFKRSYGKAGCTAPLLTATDGEEAMALIKPFATAGAALPVIVFLDLKLPRYSGFSVLEWIRSQRPLDAMPVVILSSSAEVRDVTRAYELGADGYLVKHPKPAEMGEAVAAALKVTRPEDRPALRLPGLARPDQPR